MVGWGDHRDICINGQGNGILFLGMEHHLDVIKCADWVIDLGPGGGDSGGHIVTEGPPEDIAKNPNSITGKYLYPLLAFTK
jgi:excinuclease ABC subunit A